MVRIKTPMEVRRFEVVMSTTFLRNDSDEREHVGI